MTGTKFEELCAIVTVERDGRLVGAVASGWSIQVRKHRSMEFCNSLCNKLWPFDRLQAIHLTKAYRYVGDEGALGGIMSTVDESSDTQPCSLSPECTGLKFNKDRRALATHDHEKFSYS